MFTIYFLENIMSKIFWFQLAWLGGLFLLIQISAGNILTLIMFVSFLLSQLSRDIFLPFEFWFVGFGILFQWRVRHQEPRKFPSGRPKEKKEDASEKRAYKRQFDCQENLRDVLNVWISKPTIHPKLVTMRSKSLTLFRKSDYEAWSIFTTEIIRQFLIHLMFGETLR